MIAAMDRQRVIGDGAAIPWRLKTDHARFKALTLGKPVVMGRKTVEAIGRALPGRHNIIMTHRPDYTFPNCTIVHSATAALAAAGDVPEIMICGGGVIYELFLPLADQLILTHVEAEVAGDARFPALAPGQWCETWRENYEADADNEYDFSIVAYERCE